MQRDILSISPTIPIPSASTEQNGKGIELHLVLSNCNTVFILKVRTSGQHLDPLVLHHIHHTAHDVALSLSLYPEMYFQRTTIIMCAFLWMINIASTDLK